MHDEYSQSCGKYVSWNAILFGSLVAIGLTFLFNLLTVALGLSLFSPSQSGKMALTFAGFAWILIGGYIILFLAGWVTGRIVSHKHSLHAANGILHGFLAWTIYLIISMFVLSHMASESAATLLRNTVIQSNVTHDTDLNATESTKRNVNAENDANEPSPHQVHKAGIATFATFFIFLIGAIGCCAGACYGIKECRKCHEKCTPCKKPPLQNP